MAIHSQIYGERFGPTSLGAAPKGRRRAKIAKEILIEHRTEVLDQIVQECKASIARIEHLSMKAEWAKDKVGGTSFNSLGEIQGSDHLDALVGQVVAIEQSLELLDVVLEQPSTTTKGDR